MLRSERLLYASDDGEQSILHPIYRFSITFGHSIRLQCRTVHLLTDAAVVAEAPFVAVVADPLPVDVAVTLVEVAPNLI